ncbi:MAG: hypothetical protein ACLSA2_03090 [Candidatus Gastranaerophilaceae bacterium]|nr:unknown [Clostridium sp. CAG:967]
MNADLKKEMLKNIELTKEIIKNNFEISFESYVETNSKLNLLTYILMCDDNK